MPASNVTNQREQRRAELTRERDQLASRAEAYRWLKSKLETLDDGDPHHRFALREMYRTASERAASYDQAVAGVQDRIDAVTASLSAAYNGGAAR